MKKVNTMSMEVTRRNLLVGSAALGACAVAVAGLTDIALAKEEPLNLDEPDIEPSETYECDFVVAGSGTAGLCAAIHAAELGLSDRVRIERGDLGSPVPAAAMGRLDLVVSNPPYVPTAVLADIPREVADFEPALALDGGADGNDILRRLLPWTAAALRPGGGFAFELHETCLDAAAELARQAGFHQVRIVDDLAGRPRVLTGVKPV